MSTLNLLRHPPMPPASERNSVLATLPAPQIALLAPFLREVNLATGSTLYEADDPIDYVYFPYNAVISRIVSFESGECVVSALSGREAACGVGVVLGRPCALNRAVVLIGGTAARIAAADLQAACLKSNVLRQTAMYCNSLLISQLQQSAACNACHRIEARLSRWLLECSDRVGNEVQLTQSVLAQMLGVRRTSVTTVASSLQSSGAIKYRRGAIHIFDRHALEASACECYRTVRERADHLLFAPQRVGRGVL
jgi:CRP-like cAMP-binding protein